MKALVFGGTGFIGSHVVEQLVLAGHQVTVAVRRISDTKFLEKLNVNIVPVDFSNELQMKSLILGHPVVYNCTASASLEVKHKSDAEVEIQLTRKLAETAASMGVNRFIQLSTIVVYDFNSNQPIDELYISQPEYVIQEITAEREAIVSEIGRDSGMETIILRPASALGDRDMYSFFSRLFTMYVQDAFPIVGKGATKVSFIDARDIGRAMVKLGTSPKPAADNEIYLVKGYDTTWCGLKHMIDQVTGSIRGTVSFSQKQSPIMYKNFSINRVWGDSKIRKIGFSPKYTFIASVRSAIAAQLTKNEA